MFDSFSKRLSLKEAKIAVVGLGYVGLPLAIEFAKNGFFVSGVELDKDRLAGIKEKRSYITDVTTEELKSVIGTGRFHGYDNFSAVKDADVILICVPTPLKNKYTPDISYIKSAVGQISKNIKKGALVILESTTYPGTTQEVILPIFNKQALVHDRDFFLCFSPERIDPGNIKYPLPKIPKVIGGLSDTATKMGQLVYSNIIEQVVPVSSARVAETVKLLENTFRLINIGLIDEIAMMAHKMKMDIWEIVEAASTKPFGFMPFYPGPGVGGHCIGKDPLYLYWKAKHHGFSSRFIKLASDVTSNMPDYVVSRAGHSLKVKGVNIGKANILVVGVTYKKDIKDLRKSPSLDIIDSLKKHKAKVSYYDPLIPYLKVNNIDLKSIELTKSNLSSFDCVIIGTDHSNVDYKFLLENSRFIFDARNVYKGVKSDKVERL
ncbi:MAG: nucleotide sugar dehydrogenase [Candidatus Omnitrophica bacterium]|jgi:UDP-N-acetyl-D-glucosamine dehydrogenase|nr:nucleotide sugar dehydrogenase [Candidatus Omnitrophota bacterium]